MTRNEIEKWLVENGYEPTDEENFTFRNSNITVHVEDNAVVLFPNGLSSLLVVCDFEKISQKIEDFANFSQNVIYTNEWSLSGIAKRR